jgi:predicted transcriptional regulator
MRRRRKTIILKLKALINRKAIDAAIREGLTDRKAGRTTPKFSSVKEFTTFRNQR